MPNMPRFTFGTCLWHYAGIFLTAPPSFYSRPRGVPADLLHLPPKRFNFLQYGFEFALYWGGGNFPRTSACALESLGLVRSGFRCFSGAKAELLRPRAPKYGGNTCFKLFLRVVWP